MIKKLLLLSFIFITSFAIKSNAQCAVTKSLNGSTVSFNMMWALAGIYSLDSVRVNWGDATTNLYVFPGSSSATHTYPGPGSYQFCLTRYISSLGNPGVAIPCTYCDSVIIAGSVNVCGLSAGFTPTVTASTVTTINNTIGCGSCTSLTTAWIWGDATPNGSGWQPSHTYASPGTYTICQIATGISSAGTTCLDTFCTNVTIAGIPTGCVANASFTNTSNLNNAIFTNTSSCTGCTSSTYIWDFGDGSANSTQTNTTHAYATSGLYTVCLYMTSVTSTGAICLDTICNNVNIGSPTGCTSNAGYTSTVSGPIVNFTNNSNCVNCVSSVYTWDFGDGSPTSNLTSPTHTYAASGTYNVCLYMSSSTTSGTTCLDTICNQISVTVPPPPCPANAAFTTGTVGSTTTFTNTSTCVGCTSSTYVWNFGDASPTSNVTSPVHTYVSGGVYTVCLYMTSVSSTGTTCMDTLCQTVTISTPVICNASASFTTAGGNGTFNFTSTSTCVNCLTASYDWDFGDGGTSTLQNSTHTYLNAGGYNVCLKITGTTSTGNVCKDSLCKIQMVTLSGVNDVKINALEIYPNPTKNILWVTLPINEKTTSISITDVTGRKIKTTIPSNQKDKISLDVSNLSKGIYYLELQSSKGKYISSFIVE